MTIPALRWETRPPLSARLVGSVAVVGAFGYALVTTVAHGRLSSQGWHALAEIVGAAVTPDLEPAFVAQGLHDAAITLAYATLAMVLAAAIGVVGGVLASGVLTDHPIGRLVSTSVRAALGVTRAIHELVWGLLFVLAVGLTPAVGVLAIGIPYGAIIGRIVSERLRDVPPEPLAALESAGMTRIGQLVIGRAPLAAADLSGYLWYRFECAVRSAAVLSFVGLGGLGFRIETVLADLRFDRLWTLVYLLVAMVYLIDTASRHSRRKFT